MAQPKAETTSINGYAKVFLSLHLALLRKPGRDAGRCPVFTDSGTIHHFLQWVVQTFLENVIHNCKARSRDLQAEETLGQAWVQLVRHNEIPGGIEGTGPHQRPVRHGQCHVGGG